jgi:hypothetical protein
MTRNMACSLALGALALVVPSSGSAQTFVDVGVWTRGGGGRVVVGGAPVYQVPVYPVPVYRGPVYRPVYVVPQPVYVVPQYYRGDRGRHRGWYKNGPRGYAPYSAGGYYQGYRYYDGPRYVRGDYRRRR